VIRVRGRAGTARLRREVTRSVRRCGTSIGARDQTAQVGLGGDEKLLPHQSTHTGRRSHSPTRRVPGVDQRVRARSAGMLACEHMFARQRREPTALVGRSRHPYTAPP
jgi:hypothetical protein